MGLCAYVHDVHESVRALVQYIYMYMSCTVQTHMCEVTFSTADDPYELSGVIPHGLIVQGHHVTLEDNGSAQLCV